MNRFCSIFSQLLQLFSTMVNVLTGLILTAQSIGLPAEVSYRLQKVGGMVLGMVK